MIEFQDLAPLVEGGCKPPPQLVERLVVEDQVHWFSGHPEQGKSTIALWIALQAMKEGRHVIWLDWEAGVLPTAARLAALNAPPSLLSTHFHYAGDPRLSPDASGLAELRQALETWPGALVVFDSASKALSLAGLDENNPTEVTRWTTELVMPLRALGATVLVIDHVSKNATKYVPYARGAGSKLADTEVAWYVESVEPFSRTQIGKVRLTKHKDRSGVLPGEVWLRVGDAQGGLPIEVLDGPGSNGSTKSHELRNRIRDALKANEEGLNTTQVTTLVKGKASVILEVIKEMADDGLEPVKAEARRRSIIYTYDPSVASPFVQNLIAQEEGV
jgi:AAA domain